MSQLKVTQTRSAIGTKPRHRGTLRALGLGRIGKSRILPDRPEINGMIRSVSHLVSFEEVAKKPAAAKSPSAKSTASKTTASKPTASKTTASKTTAAKSSAPKAAEAKPAAAKPAAKQADKTDKKPAADKVAKKPAAKPATSKKETE